MAKLAYSFLCHDSNEIGSGVLCTLYAIKRIEQVIHQPYQTLETAISTFTDQNYGAKKYIIFVLLFAK